MNPDNRPYFTVSLDRQSIAKAGKIFLMSFLFLATGYVIWLFLTKLQSVSIPFLLSVLFTFLLEPLVGFLESKGLNRMQATTLIFIIILLIIGIGFWLLLPVLGTQVQAIQAHLQSGDITDRIAKITGALQEKYSFLGKSGTSSDLTLKIQGAMASIQENILNFAMGLFSALSNIVIIPFIIFFLLKDGPNMKKGMIARVPNRYFEMVLNLIYKIELQLGGYIRGQMLDSLIIGILSIVALYILKIDYYFFIGAIAGLANMIPYLGPVVGAVPAILVSLMGNPSITPIIWIAVSFALIQLIDNVIISPLIVAKSVNIHPLLVIIVIFIGERLLGVLGMLIAVPVTGILNVIIKETIWSFRNYRLL